MKAESPGQTSCAGLISNINGGLVIVYSIESVTEFPQLSVTFIVYIVVVDGVTVIALPPPRFGLEFDDQ